MKQDFSKATLQKAELLAKEKGFGAIATIIAGEAESGLDTVLLQAVERGDEKTVRLLLGVRDPGVKMPDGTIYAGKSPNSGKELFTTPANAGRVMTFKDADRYAKKLTAHGHKDWRLPTREELKILFKNQAEIGGFSTVPGRGLAHWHWSCTEHRGEPSSVWVVVFNKGNEYGAHKDHSWLSARAVRAEP